MAIKLLALFVARNSQKSWSARSSKDQATRANATGKGATGGDDDDSVAICKGKLHIFPTFKLAMHSDSMINDLFY